jgi:hypothetical protein
MRNHLLPPAALVAILLTSSTTETQAESARLEAPAETLGLRTDRLSAKQLERWQAILRLVFAEDGLGRPLHPTLRRMWDRVAASGHEVYVELPRRFVPRAAGRFLIESVRPDGHAVAVVRVHLETIDRVDVEREKPHSGFHPFHGLGPEERYAEVLGHELGHAVWSLESPERARLTFELQGRLGSLARALWKAKSHEREGIRRQLAEFEAQCEAIEAVARAAEARVWVELLASQAARGVQIASASRPGSIASQIRR